MLPVRQCDVYHPHAGVAAGSGGGWWSRRRRYAEVERGLLTGPEPPLVLCLSEYVKRDFRKHYVMDERRLVGLFNAVDLGRFDPAGFGREDGVRAELGIGGEQVMALMIAQDFARKGLREGIQALAQVNDGRLRLVVVGGDGSGPYRRLARRLGVGGQVIFVGAKADPVGYYAAADFFLLPTHHDPCSLVVLESLAMGLPVISTAQNGACEVMRDGQEGFVLPEPSDVVGLAGAIRAMLDGAARDRMRAACLALRPKLSQEEHMRQLLRAYQTARQGRGAAGGD